MPPLARTVRSVITFTSLDLSLRQLLDKAVERSIGLLLYHILLLRELCDCLLAIHIELRLLQVETALLEVVVAIHALLLGSRALALYVQTHAVNFQPARFVGAPRCKLVLQ